jgi:hypothetical protein
VKPDAPFTARAGARRMDSQLRVLVQKMGSHEDASRMRVAKRIGAELES